MSFQQGSELKTIMTLRKHIYLLRGRGRDLDCPLLQLPQLRLLLLQLLLLLANMGRQLIIHRRQGGCSVKLASPAATASRSSPPAPRLLARPVRPVFLDTTNVMK